MHEVFDVVVVGAGHAGVEAALAASRTGCRTLLLTYTPSLIGCLSCNPAIGGVGKGQIVREIDALGGEMARAADAACIQFRTLNLSKGPAVWSSRAQVDRNLYAAHIRRTVSTEKTLTVSGAEVAEILVASGRVRGVKTSSDETIPCACAIICAGTFLDGCMHFGMETTPGGRMEEPVASTRLASCLRDLGFPLRMFKTGTCCRIAGGTIDTSGLAVQHGDAQPRPFSLSTQRICRPQVPCYVTFTTHQTHDIIRRNLDRSPLFSGKITGTGVRYCPSIEDKVVKFLTTNATMCFWNRKRPMEDHGTPNGLSTSLPPDVQEEFIRSIPGLRTVRILRYGYGIEHGVIDARLLHPTLRARAIEGLFFAGQINGTTGYEEAAAQGIVAGINASLSLRGEEPLLLDRSSSYIGVMLDDLTTVGTDEPYRMFTSRAEHRLSLREDTSDLRLGETGRRVGLLDDLRWRRIETMHREMEQWRKRLDEPAASDRSTLREVLREMDILHPSSPPGWDADPEVLRRLAIEVAYEPYIERTRRRLADEEEADRIRIPETLRYDTVPGLSLEVREKLARMRPLTIGQARRIPGVTPAAVLVLRVFLSRKVNRR